MGTLTLKGIRVKPASSTNTLNRLYRASASGALRVKNSAHASGLPSPRRQCGRCMPRQPTAPALDRSDLLSAGGGFQQSRSVQPFPRFQAAGRAFFRSICRLLRTDCERRADAGLHNVSQPLLCGLDSIVKLPVRAFSLLPAE